MVYSGGPRNLSMIAGKVVALFLFLYSNLDSSNDDENMETNSSIKSYDGSTDNLTLEEFAQYELGETKQVIYWIIIRSSITESSFTTTYSL